MLTVKTCGAVEVEVVDVVTDDVASSLISSPSSASADVLDVSSSVSEVGDVSVVDVSLEVPGSFGSSVLIF